MNNLNLDISKYSCDELYEIFSIDEKTRNNENNLMNHFTSFKNSIINNNSLPISKKDNITIFLAEALEKLLTNVNKKDSTNISNLTYDSKINNIISESPDNHPIIANQNEIAGLKSRTYDGDTPSFSLFKPGYINPINIKSIYRSINIDTRFRDNYFSNKSTDFTVDIPDTFKKVVKMKLTAFEMPTTLHSIKESYGNNFFHYEIFNLGSDNSIINSNLNKFVLEDGNYSNIFSPTTKFGDSNNIETIINVGSIISSLFESFGIKYLTYSIDKVSGKSKFISDGFFKLYFNLDKNNNDDLDTPLIMKLGWLLGFRLGEYESQINSDGIYEIISEGICNMNSPQYLFLSINDFTNAANNNFIAAFNSSILSPHILSRLNYQSLLRSSGVYNYSDSINQDLDDENRVRNYFGPVDINRLHIQILDEYGRIVDLNNMDWSFTLTLELLYN